MTHSTKTIIKKIEQNSHFMNTDASVTDKKKLTKKGANCCNLDTMTFNLSISHPRDI